GLMYENGLGVSQDFREARACYEIAAKQGSAAAANNLGVLYQFGLGVQQDFKKALLHYQLAAEKKSVCAFFNMGLLYRYGLGVQPDEEKVKECVDKAIALKDPTRFNGLDEYREHNKFLLLAQTHHPEAQFQLGLMYMKGLGVKQSDTNTVRYLTDADENHHPKAAFMLGESYMARSFFRRDITQALRWYKKASEAGDGDASYRVAKLLAEADNKKNAQEIRRYLNIANHQGHPTAEQKLIEWENFWKLNPAEVQEQIVLERAYELKKDQLYLQAFELYSQLAEKGSSFALNNMGYFFQHGLGVSRDFEQAMVLYQKAAEKGNAFSYHNLGHMYQYGLGVLQDLAVAKSHYEAAADKGNTRAFISLGYLYQHGLGVSQDYAKAMTHYVRAAENGNRRAYNNIGYLYHYGLGIPQSFEWAINCYQTAMVHGSASAFKNMGVLHQLGLGVPEDFKEAMSCYQTAAEKKCLHAFFNMGLLYRYGLGVEQSEQKAEECVNKAIALGGLTLLKSMDEYQFKILNEALTYLEKKIYAPASIRLLLLAPAHHPEVQFQLGVMYMKGLGVKQSDTNTVRYLTDADKNDHPQAAFMLGESYMGRSVLRRDKSKALLWYKKASKAGNSEASYRIAELFINSNITKDAHEIRHYLNLARDQGHPTAEQKLNELEKKHSWNWNFGRVSGSQAPFGLKGDLIEDDEL
ncbi:MAG: hypothetical protein K0R08_2297, partial [Solimicrobium sp.]|nr:hypothetical protein [Solimicrobium sp.]